MNLVDNKFLVSIITPSYNQGKYIEETILSVLNQTYKNIEYIVVDGGSTDNTLAVIDKYRDKISCVISETDEGQTDAINKGFKIAKGELVGWINSDDILYPDCVEKIVDKYINNPKCAIIYNDLLDWIDEDTVIIDNRSIIIPSRKYLLNRNYSIIQQGSFYKKEFVIKVGYLDKKLYYCMDLALWLDLLNHGEIIGIRDGKAHAAFRNYPGTKTSTGKIKFLKEIKKVILTRGGCYSSINIVIRYYWYSLKYYMRLIYEGFIRFN